MLCLNITPLPPPFLKSKKNDLILALRALKECQLFVYYTESRLLAGFRRKEALWVLRIKQHAQTNIASFFPYCAQMSLPHCTPNKVWDCRAAEALGSEKEAEFESHVSWSAVLL